MLNNKKSFLQKARIAMVAIVTIMSVGGAFAMKAPTHKGAMTYNVLSTVGNNYNVTQSAGICTGSTHVCKITSNVAPVNGQIPVSDAITKTPGVFSE